MSADTISRRQGDGAAQRSRRAVIAGATGALGVVAAEALAKAAPARAANGDPVLQGTVNGPATATTAVTNSNGSRAELAGTGTGLFGTGPSSGGAGVEGIGGGSSPGLLGRGGTGGGDGVQGVGSGPFAQGVFGTGAGGGSGVTGNGGPSNGAGVTGNGGGNGHGVAGFGGSPVANGVAGFGGPGRGAGVVGVSANGAGTGVLAWNTAGGTALKVSGTAAFSRSGVLTVGAGKSSATKTGVPLTSASLVLATFQQDRAGVWVRSAVPNVAGSSFTVHLSKAVAASTKVAWFIAN